MFPTGGAVARLRQYEGSGQEQGVTVPPLTCCC